MALGYLSFQFPMQCFTSGLPTTFLRLTLTIGKKKNNTSDVGRNLACWNVETWIGECYGGTIFFLCTTCRLASTTRTLWSYLKFCKFSNSLPLSKCSLCFTVFNILTLVRFLQASSLVGISFQLKLLRSSTQAEITFPTKFQLLIPTSSSFKSLKFVWIHFCRLTYEC